LLRDRFDRIACILPGDAASRAEDGVRWVRELTRDLGIPGLAHWGLAADQIAPLVRQSQKASSMKANPIDLDESELTEILHTARFSGACR
jgi:alcohol dehydrogenase class IV